MSSNRRETSFPQPPSKESICESIHKTNKAAGPTQQAQRGSYAMGQSYMIPSMFFEPIIPWGRLQVCLLNSNMLIRSFVSQEWCILFQRLERSTLLPLLPPQKNVKTWAACNCFLINLSQVWTKGWHAAWQKWPVSQRWTNSSCTWSSQFFQSFPSSPHLSLTEGVAQAWPQTFSIAQPTQSRKRERLKEPL